MCSTTGTPIYGSFRFHGNCGVKDDHGRPETGRTGRFPSHWEVSFNSRHVQWHARAPPRETRRVSSTPMTVPVACVWVSSFFASRESCQTSWTSGRVPYSHRLGFAVCTENWAAQHASVTRQTLRPRMQWHAQREALPPHITTRKTDLELPASVRSQSHWLDTAGWRALRRRMRPRAP